MPQNRKRHPLRQDHLCGGSRKEGGDDGKDRPQDGPPFLFRLSDIFFAWNCNAWHPAWVEKNKSKLYSSCPFCSLQHAGNQASHPLQSFPASPPHPAHRRFACTCQPPCAFNEFLFSDILFIKQTHDLLKQIEPCSTDSAKWLHVENNPDFSRQRLGTERIPMFSAL